ncbi:MAG: peptidylprolyl isomerase [Flavobacteriales bacterium]|nr:peptidylprolyl isomerase [Flavobacteriales bacterium]
MRHLMPAILLLNACQSAAPPPNRWADERLWPVLEAQEHRDADALCALLEHEAPEVREAAALGLASVQDNLATPCLLEALSDEIATVRATAAYALGFVGDSLALQRMAELTADLKDSAMLASFEASAFTATQRAGRLMDANAILHYFERSTGHERVRAADALRRLPDSLLIHSPEEISRLMADSDAEVRARAALAMRKLGPMADTASLHALARNELDRGTRVNAIRTCTALNCITDEELFDAARTLELRIAGLEALNSRVYLNPLQCHFHQKDAADQALGIALLGLAAKHSTLESKGGLCEQLEGFHRLTTSPYDKARAISALLSAGCWLDLGLVLSMIRSTEHAVIRQAALQGAIAIARDHMSRARFTNVEAQYAELASVISEAVHTGDAGLISAAAESIEQEKAEVIRILLPPEVEQQAFAPLGPIRDLEARLLLQKAIAKRDGLLPPAHERPAFNHPIDKEKLLALKQGQQYRIITNKGQIIIATDVNECPGSSLAFDSLVTAGYYNGKAFHRMVPNFVVQGGCPRGDGYGGMPWTLRTEIGRSPFTAGSVGLASAGPDTESCQFFITHSAAPHLDGRYTRFGEVVSGMDVVWMLQVGDVMERVERFP